MAEQRLNTGATMSIGIGAMVGGGIFAVTGIAVEWTRGAIPLAFIVAGAVALLTAYSYWRITLRYPSQGGTVSYLNRAFGRGFPTGAFNIQLCLNYIVLLAIYSYAFGAYGAKLFPPDQPMDFCAGPPMETKAAAWSVSAPEVDQPTQRSTSNSTNRCRSESATSSLRRPGIHSTPRG